jgi:hypothetical protein
MKTSPVERVVRGQHNHAGAVVRAKRFEGAGARRGDPGIDRKGRAGSRCQRMPPSVALAELNVSVPPPVALIVPPRSTGMMLLPAFASV